MNIEYMTVKELHTKRRALQSEIAEVKRELDLKHKDNAVRKNTLQRIQERINQLENPVEPTISEHALLRYCERVMGINMDEVKQKILNDRVKTFITQLGGSGQFPAGGFHVVMKNNVVTTILPTEP